MSQQPPAGGEVTEPTAGRRSGSRRAVRVAMMVAVAALVVGAAAGTRYYDVTRTPRAIHRACALVETAYEDANRVAVEQNRRNIAGGTQSVASMFWTAADQAKLDEAARIIEDAGGYGSLPEEWKNVAIQISAADHDLGMQLAGNEPTGPDPLMAAQAACAGR
jgi:hypothetical protein